ncbi:MAG: hlyIII [Clostridiales bacterium]|jgi:hemolysin III|nr:hlyIII [Clostridiales bacterium]
MKNVENFTRGEEITNAILHGIGSGLAIAALVILIVFASIKGDARYVVSYTIYGSTLVLLYLASTLYHSFPRGKTKNVFEIFDHSAIYLLIAGSYTPLALVALKGTLGWIMFGIVWGLSVIGIVFKVFWVKKFVVLSTVLYIAMGWLIIIAIKPLMEFMSTTSLVFLVAGGVLYTVGTIFYVWRGMKYHHAIWHLFVLGGSICHFFSMIFMLP